MIRKVPAYILCIITLSIEVIYNIIMLFIYKISSNSIDSLVLALWSWPLLLLVIVTFVVSIVRFHKQENKNKKDIAAVIMGSISLIYFFLYAIMLGFLIGTGHLPFYYFPDGF